MKKRTKIVIAAITAFALVITTVLIYRTVLIDEYGTPWHRWNWTYGLVDGERITSSYGFITGGQPPWAQVTTSIMGLRDAALLLDNDEIIVNQNAIVLSVAVSGAIPRSYVQISVNGDLVRHRWPEVDAVRANRLHRTVELGIHVYQTERFSLLRGRNEIVITAICSNRTYLNRSTFYIIRE